MWKFVKANLGPPCLCADNQQVDNAIGFEGFSDSVIERVLLAVY